MPIFEHLLSNSLSSAASKPICRYIIFTAIFIMGLMTKNNGGWAAGLIPTSVSYLSVIKIFYSQKCNSVKSNKTKLFSKKSKKYQTREGTMELL